MMKTMRIVAALLFIAVLFAAAAYNALENRAVLAWLVERSSPFESVGRFASDVTEARNSLSYSVAHKRELQNFHGALWAAVGKRMLGSWPVVKLPGGLLNTTDVLPPDYPSIQVFSSYFHHLKNIASDGGAVVLYVNPPDRVFRGVTEIPAGLPIQDKNSVEDSILFYLREYGVPYLDARELFADGDLRYQDIVYKTAFGWTVPAAFKAFSGIVSTLERDGGLALDPDGFYRDPANYDWTTLPQAFYGEFGRSTGGAFSGMDDFTYFEPKFERNYSVDMIDPGGNFTTASGTEKEALLNYDELKPKPDPDEYSPSDLYLGMPKAWTQIRNLDNPDGKRLLVVSDIYGPPLTVLLAPLFGETHAIWAYDGQYSLNISKYLSGLRFDAVVFVISPGSFFTPTMQHFTDRQHAGGR